MSAPLRSVRLVALGDALAAPFDFDGDGLDDLAVGAFRADPLGRVDAGLVAVVLGRTSLPPVIDLAAPPPGVVLIYGREPGAAFGVRLAPAGDVDGDGRGDLLIGAINATPGGLATPGAAYVVYDGVTSAHLAATLTGTAAAGGAVAVTIESPVGTAALLCAAVAPSLPPVEVFPYDYGLALDLPSLVVAVPYVLPPSGVLTLPIAFPPTPALQGLTVPLQALVTDPGGGAFSNVVPLEFP